MYLQSNNEHKWIIEMNEKRNVKQDEKSRVKGPQSRKNT